LKILLTADVHVGRRSSRLPSKADGHTHSCAAAWGRIVDCALAEKVDLLVIAGDLIDESNRYLEAVGAVEQGLKRLAGAGIETIVVAGNHDHEVLPQVVDSIGSDTIRLLGRQGKWERYTVERRNERIHFDGWSFPHSHFPSSPLQNYAPTLDGTPTVALLHADLEQPRSPYAPLFLAELRRHSSVLFFLGHVHAPWIEEEPGGARFIYPGSPQAIDRGETGDHGVWVVENRGSQFHFRQVPLSTIRYLPVELSVDDVERVDEVDNRLYAAVRARAASAGTSGPVRCVRCRVHVTGRTRFQRQIEQRLTELAGELEVWNDETAVSIDSFDFDTQPAHDLRALAKGLGAPAILATLLEDPELNRGLAAELRRVVTEIHGSRSFAEVAGGEDDLEALQLLALDEVRRSANLLLDDLLQQKVGSS
jgi:DNA repair protein SbcD/Mre11